MRYLAIDYGKKRVGLAICDESETIASPLAVIEGRVDVFVAIGKVVRAEGVGAVVVGLPLNMDGSSGPQAKLVERFAERLAKATGAPCWAWATGARIAESSATRRSRPSC